MRLASTALIDCWTAFVATTSKKAALTVQRMQLSSDRIITPLSDKTKFNYGPFSNRDNVVATCERPGDHMWTKATMEDQQQGKISVQISLESWVPFIRDEQGVQHVLILFDENEMDHYDENLLKAYERAGLTAHWEPLSKPLSFGRIMAILDACFDRGERITAHCTGGVGRSGRVAAGWLMHKYQLSDKDATLEVLACATAHGVSRLGSPVELNKWLAR